MNASPVIFDFAGKRVFVAGHAGMAGSAIVRRLQGENCNIVTAARCDLDLRQSDAVDRFMAQAKPDAIFVAAGKVGGIRANSTFPADFIADNIAIVLNIIRAAHRCSVKKLLYLGSSCIYPRQAQQPMTPDLLLSGELEPTNQWYAIAKIAGIKLCQAFRLQHGADFISVMPTNLYGPGDNYHPDDSHVPAALMRRFHEAKLAHAPCVTVWGTGTPRREFLAVDDLADACVFVMKRYSDLDFINIGSGVDTTIAEFAHLIADVVGYRGQFEFDTSRPDGSQQKLLNVSHINLLGWRARTPLREGLTQMYGDFLTRYTA
ncbi:MAG TPA: GDP-L-fucose synthase [Xanthobacteraceae bacterium]|jgi:GDP-L-fucose synthase|nr:GDP-L-fucose synthase [Xanthobacteraceae bacterium]